jgi:hypothetical protein
MTTEGPRLKVDSIGCRGYPILYSDAVPTHLLAEAGRAGAACPTLALRVGKAPG